MYSLIISFETDLVYLLVNPYEKGGLYCCKGIEFFRYGKMI